MSDQPDSPAPRNPWAPPADVPSQAGPGPRPADSGPPLPPPPPLAPGAEAYGDGAYGYDPSGQYDQPGQYEQYQGAGGYQPGYLMGPYGGWSPTPRNGFGLTALVLGIVGVVLSVMCVFAILGAPLGIAAIIFGIVGRRIAKRGESTNGGQALAGLILGITATVLSAGMLVTIGLSVNRGWLDNGSGMREPDRGTYGSPLAVGETARYDSGLQVTIDGVQDSGRPPATQGGGSALKFTVTVKNTGGGTENLDYGDVSAYADQEGDNPLKDISGQDGFSGQLAPGAVRSLDFIVVVPNADYESVEVDVSPGDAYDYAYWNVPVPVPTS
ncbi:DUF4190 domain-containing protein [Streptomyces sp. H10-C2]|uniref:DUF4190 domain-containing protein n=1 Tax=unclassified Streptomyces TaxID=2593676 RepID=UPI0024BA5C96|nr:MULTISPECIES: DUF4190 domain-containing protein [unclassified Streptomyces]MDJ0343323.1 DUF4190 domain-containing protein [Streptomyces sp. PH10-H1]MDJ0372892.1 DUF4190 domain-containing protein [Streptomyces sp. H10-C2]